MRVRVRMAIQDEHVYLFLCNVTFQADSWWEATLCHASSDTCYMVEAVINRPLSLKVERKAQGQQATSVSSHSMLENPV